MLRAGGVAAMYRHWVGLSVQRQKSLGTKYLRRDGARSDHREQRTPGEDDNTNVGWDS